MDSLPLCLHGKIFSFLENGTDKKALVSSSKQLFHANPYVMHQLTRLHVFADTTYEHVDRIPHGACMQEVIVHQAPYDQELWFHANLKQVRVVTFMPYEYDRDEDEVSG